MWNSDNTYTFLEPISADTLSARSTYGAVIAVPQRHDNGTEEQRTSENAQKPFHKSEKVYACCLRWLQRPLAIWKIEYAFPLETSELLVADRSLIWGCYERYEKISGFTFEDLFNPFSIVSILNGYRMVSKKKTCSYFTVILIFEFTSFIFFYTKVFLIVFIIIIISGGFMRWRLSLQGLNI